MSTRTTLIDTTRVLARWSALALTLAIAQFVSGMVTYPLLAHAVSATFLNVQTDWLAFFTVAGLEAAAVHCLLTGLRVQCKRQIWILFAFYWGTKCLQMNIEAAFFLNVWQTAPMMSWAELAFCVCYSTLTSLLFVPLAVWIVNAKPKDVEQPAWLPPLASTLKIGALYVPIYFVAGFVLAIPLAGSAFAGTYENLQLPAWIPVFQFARGVLWAVILWFVIGNHGRARDSRVTAAMALGIVSSFQLLLPNPYMTDQLRAAHLTEVLFSMTLFGWLAAHIFRQDPQQHAELDSKLERASPVASKV